MKKRAPPKGEPIASPSLGPLYLAKASDRSYVTHVLDDGRAPKAMGEDREPSL